MDGSGTVLPMSRARIVRPESAGFCPPLFVNAIVNVPLIDVLIWRSSKN
jgi:hypothetical protein